MLEKGLYMSRPAAVVLAMLLTSVVRPCAASDSPSANVLFQLQKSNRERPWLRISTDSGTVTRRVHLVDHLGLYDLTAPDGMKQAGPMLWSDIHRVDEVVTRSKPMERFGGIVFGLAFAGLGNALGAPDHSGGRLALGGLIVGGAGGGWLGSRFGERFKHERPWYVPDTSSRIASADTSAPAPEVDGTPVAAAVLRACNRISRTERIRVYSSFGTFEGTAGTAGPAGLEDLRARRRTRPTATTPALPALIPWDAINRVEARGGTALAGGAAGAVAFGGFGAVVGLAAVVVSGTDAATPAAGAAIGALYCAPVGFVIGGLGGMAFRRWVPIYKRPRVSPRDVGGESIRP